MAFAVNTGGQAYAYDFVLIPGNKSISDEIDRLWNAIDNIEKCDCDSGGGGSNCELQPCEFDPGDNWECNDNECSGPGY